MVKRKRLVLTLILAIIFICAVFALFEQISLSSKTIDVAFVKFINNEFSESTSNNIGDKSFYQIENDIFVPFEVGDDVSLVQFEKGIFGWKQKYYSHNKNGGYSYSSSQSDDNNLFHGIIPKDIVTETSNIKVNGLDAETIMLNNNTGVWIMMADNDSDGEHDFNKISVDFLDKDGNVILKL